MNKIYALIVCGVLLAACGGGGDSVPVSGYGPGLTPTVDYVEGLDVYSSQHRDSFLNMLAMNYRSFAIFNARTSGHYDIGERFAQKAVAAFSGEAPYPENVADWGITNRRLRETMDDSYNELISVLRDDAPDLYPELAAEAQAKFDCWVAATASCQDGTATECRRRFELALAALNDNMRTGGSNKIVRVTTTSTGEISRRTAAQQRAAKTYYPATTDLQSATATNRAREGVVIVNNVNVPHNLIQPQPVPTVQPIVFNQNIVTPGHEVEPEPRDEINVIEEKIMMSDDLVSRDEFIRAMNALRRELAAINRRLDDMEVGGDKTIVKVQQIPLEPRQHIMEEVFEIRFDFNRAEIKPEYEDLIRNLVAATRDSHNVKISVIGHTDTVGTDAFNFALGGRRAEAVRKMLVKYGIPASQIVAVSSGKNDLKVQTGDNVKNAENRRVRVIKEQKITEPAVPMMPMQGNGQTIQVFAEGEDGRIMGFPVQGGQVVYIDEGGMMDYGAPLHMEYGIPPPYGPQ